MLKRLSILALLLALTAAVVAGCCTATQGTTSSQKAGRDTVLYAAPFDKVWGAVVATLAEEEYPIGAIEKSSGLITTQQMILSEDWQAIATYVVVPTGLFGMSEALERLRVMLNVNVISQDSGSTRVKVAAHFEGIRMGKAGAGWEVCGSRGLLEKRLLDAVRAKL